MARFKTLTMAAALIVGATSFAVAQGPPTGGYPPVGGGAAASPIPSTGGTGAAPAKATHKKTLKPAKKKSETKPQ
jgi:hypothetical protein